ncbi:MAG: cytochrome c1 [Neomegalonema sp.]|nr:cytochrome c1 [Neomegalonema sp.]
MRFVKTLMATAVALTLGAGSAMAAGGGTHVIDHTWSFEGVFGKFDRAQLQRGFQVYKEVCASCHSLELVSFRNLGEPGGPQFPEEQVKAIAASFTVIDGPDAEGEMFERPGVPADKFPAPFPNVEAAKASNGGAYPPDLSLITKARAGYHGILTQMVQGAGGPEYIYSLLNGYTEEPPEGLDPGELNYNAYFPGYRIAMAQPLYEDSVEYQDGTAATIEQQSADVVAFLAWAAEPKMEARKQAGVRNILLLIIFGVLLWYSNKQLWKPVKYGQDA